VWFHALRLGARIGKWDVMNKVGTCQVELFRVGSDVPAVQGTDNCIWVDGRWGRERAYDYVANYAYDRAESLGLEWRGTVYLLGGRYRSVKLSDII